MKIAQVNVNQNPTFKNRFYNVTRELDSSVMLSRSIVDMFGCCIPWLILANNNTERKEKARKFSFEYFLAWISPFITIPLSNRFVIKYVSKLTKNFWSNTHKAIHISNESLVDTKSMMAALNKLSQNVQKYPIEGLYYKLNSRKHYNSKFDVDELLKSCGGDEEKLRRRLISAKNAVFISDCIFTSIAMGSFPFLNNEITKKGSGQSGFSAEMSMADKKIVEGRAKNYEKTKRNRLLTFIGVATGTSVAMSVAAFASLYSKNNSKLVRALKKNAKLFDYHKGIYMSRLPMAIVVMLSSLGFILSARNKTEEKDLIIRNGIGYSVFFGGDLLMASLFTNLSDRILGTKLRKDDGSNKFAINKIFPKFKSVKQVIEEVEQGKIPKINKKVSVGIFWTNMLLLMVSMGYAVPTAINRMIKKDVESEVQSQSKIKSSVEMKNFIKPGGIENFIKKVS